jgi:hypothetical protein
MQAQRLQTAASKHFVKLQSGELRRGHADVTQAKARKTPVVGWLVGYARVSTDDQGTDPQRDELRAGETLVVVRLDRLARSVSHLLAVIEQLGAAGGAFSEPTRPDRHLHPQGMFSFAGAGSRRPARARTDR